MKITVIAGAVLIVVLSVLYFILPAKPATAPATDLSTPTVATDTPAVATTTIHTSSTPTTPAVPVTPVPPSKLKVANFTGTLEKVNTGCFSDGECYVVIDGKHITTTIGWSQDEVGTIIGSPSIGDLESAIGAKVEVYAKDNLDGTYTLYGSKGFYIKVVSKPISSGKCIVGGCSSQLCVDESEGNTVTNCMWSEQYACYKTAECKRQTTGECGWSNTPELNQCLASKVSAN